MDGINSTILDILMVWGVVTAALIALVVYRGTIEIREDDQIFLEALATSGRENSKRSSRR